MKDTENDIRIYLRNWLVLQPVLLDFSTDELLYLYEVEMKGRNRAQIKKRIKDRLGTLACKMARESIDETIRKLENGN